MKFSLFIIATFAQSAHSFAPYGNFGVSRASSAIENSRIDTTEAVQAALAASKKHGATSKEARVAWDMVEEMDASDNSVAYAPAVNEDECLVTESMDPTCQDYDAKIAELSEAVEKAKVHLDTMKRVAQEIQVVKIQPAPAQSVPVVSEKMSKAIADAKAAGDKYGATSKEAKLQWENVEEMASARENMEVMKPSLDDECLLEMMSACEALDEMSRVLNLQKSTSRYSG